MRHLTTAIKKTISLGTAALLILILLATPFSQIITAEEPDSPFQAAPLNPAFLKYVQSQQSQMRALRAVPSQNYGYIPPPFDLSHLSSSPVSDVGTFINSYSTESLPDSFDWRTTNKVTPVKDQEYAGTCWIFGTLASLESRVGIVENADVTADANYDFSEQNLFTAVDPAFLWDSDEGGNSLMSTDTLIKVGTRLESVQPYDDDTLDSESCDTSTDPLQKVTDFRYVTDSGIGFDNITLIKNTIRTYGPVSAAYYHNDAKIYAGYKYYYPLCSEDANHMISIVGWDDNLAHPAGGGVGAWIVKNSWGTTFGNSGYFFLCYDSANLQEVGSYHGSAGYHDYNPAENLYFWDEVGMVTAIGAGTNTCWMRSVFMAQNPGLLTSIGFWTTENNAQYEIYVRDAFSTMLLPSAQTGDCAEMGYYTIPLTSPVPVSVGQTFKIDVKMTTPGYDSPIPIEFDTPDDDPNDYCDPPLQSGVSFVSTNGNTWNDASEIIIPGEDYTINGFNVCLRATVTEVIDPIVSVGLQGRTEASASAVSLTVNFFTPSANLTGTPAYSFTDEVTRDGSTAAIQCDDIAFNTYDITAVSSHTLVNVKRNVPINALNTSVSLGTLPEGNANDDNKINIFDYGILFYSWNKRVGQAGYNAAADFNMDGTVDVKDFDLLKANYGKVSDP